MPLNKINSLVFGTLTISALTNQTDPIQKWSSTGSNYLAINPNGFIYGSGTYGTFTTSAPQFDINGNFSVSSASIGQINLGSSSTENYIAFRGTTGDNPGGFDHGYIGERIYGGSEQSEILIFKGNDIDSVSGYDRIRLLAANHVFDTYTSAISGTFSAVGAAAVNTRMIIRVGGQVGINTTTPETLGYGSVASMLGIVPNATTSIGLVIKGAVSQTGDLTQWQNSSGSILTKIDSSGFFSTPKINFTGGTSTISALTLADGAVSFESTAGQLFSISNSLTGTIFSVNDISGLPSFEITDIGIVKLNELYGQTVFGSGTPVTNAQVSAVAKTVSAIPLVIKGAVSQTANLQEWQNSAGTVLNYITSGGSFGVPNNAAIILGNSLSTGTEGSLRLLSGSGTNYIQSGLNITGGSAAPLVIGSIYAWSEWIRIDNTGTVNIAGFGASNKGLIVKAAASQTANLQEWQNSAGTVLTNIDSSGNIYAPFLWASTVRFGDRYNWSGSSTINILNALNIPGIIIKAYGAQTADLQQWQNNSGTVIAKIDKDGNLTANNVRGSGAFNYVQTLGTKQTSISGASAALVSATITTVGYPVHIVVTGDAENNSAGGWARLQLYRDSTAIGNKVHVEGSAGSENIPFALQFIDTPSAGTYTYSIKTVDTSGGTFNFGETDGPTITVIELGK